MFALRYAALLALIVWAGGLVALGGVAAPSIFAIVGTSQIPDARSIAGAVFGEALRRFHLVSYVCGAVLLASLAARAILGPRPRRFGVRLAIAVVMFSASLYSGLVVSPRIQRLRSDIGISPSTLPAADARRVEFGRLHRQSTTLEMVPVLGALLLLAWELRD